MIKKFLSVCLCFVLVYSFVFPVFAKEIIIDEEELSYTDSDVLNTDEENIDTDIPSSDISDIPVDNTDIPENDIPDDNIDNTDNSVTDSEKYIAIIYLCESGPHAPYIFGHVWICLKNITDDYLSVGKYIVKPGETVSFGSHHFDGVHLNEEMNRFRGCSVNAIERYITSDILDRVADEISSSRWSWYEYFTHNCTNFASAVWSIVSGRKYFCFCFPFVIGIQMLFENTIKLRID